MHSAPDMRIPPDLTPIKPPWIFPNKASTAASAQAASEAICAVYDNCLRYVGAVAPHEFCRNNIAAVTAYARHSIENGIEYDSRTGTDIFPIWEQSARRLAALAAHDFGEAFRIAQAKLLSDPVLTVLIDKGAFKPIGKKLRALFPASVAARNAAAHPEAFLQRDHGLREGHEVEGVRVPPTTTIQDGYIEGFYTTSFNGVAVTCPISPNAAIELTGITNDFVRVLAPLAE